MGRSIESLNHLHFSEDIHSIIGGDLAYDMSLPTEMIIFVGNHLPSGIPCRFFGIRDGKSHATRDSD
jgi:hypothetical protein